uniref:Uncharacterized protein n=1 Tax=Panagrolaimus sp. ES5 TaxID=591445 RepID=A0AC34F3D7_9BILA
MESSSSSQKIQITLRASLDFDKLEVPIDQKIIDSSTFLTNLSETCTEDTIIDVNMTSKQLKQFITFFDHYPSAKAPQDEEFETTFFGALTDDEFYSLCNAIDFFDSDRFTEAAGDFVLRDKIPGMKTEEIRDYLGIKDDMEDKKVELLDPSALEYFRN